MKLTSFTHICREIKDVPIYALYPESFCMKNLATRKVFAFSDSAYNHGHSFNKNFSVSDQSCGQAVWFKG